MQSVDKVAIHIISVIALHVYTYLYSRERI